MSRATTGQLGLIGRPNIASKALKRHRIKPTNGADLQERPPEHERRWHNTCHETEMAACVLPPHPAKTGAISSNLTSPKIIAHNAPKSVQPLALTKTTR